jgi:hypothetical protein
MRAKMLLGLFPLAILLVFWYAVPGQSLSLSLDQTKEVDGSETDLAAASERPLSVHAEEGRLAKTPDDKRSGLVGIFAKGPAVAKRPAAKKQNKVKNKNKAKKKNKNKNKNKAKNKNKNKGKKKNKNKNKNKAKNKNKKKQPKKKKDPQEKETTKEKERPQEKETTKEKERPQENEAKPPPAPAVPLASG